MNEAHQEFIWEELIGGEIVAMSPRPSVDHTRVSGNIYRIFSEYLKNRPCEPFPDGVDLYLSEEDQFIPDGMIVCDPEKIQSDGVHGAPDLVIEVLSPSTARYDRGRKQEVYQRCGVREYWIVSPTDKTVEQYLLADGAFVLHDVYLIPNEVMLKKMKEEERAQIKKDFQCSLYDDLTISLADVFYRVK